MYRVIRKVVNVLCLFWWFIIISTEVHPFIFGAILSKSLVGIFYVIGAVVVVALAIAFHKWDVLGAAIFAALIYIGVVWTSLPVSKLLVDPKWQFIPWGLLLLFNVFDIGEIKRR